MRNERNEEREYEEMGGSLSGGHNDIGTDGMRR